MPEGAAETRRILVYTDGACLGNPGPGGWAARIKMPRAEWQSISGKERQTTNNRMELTAALKALQILEKTSEPVALYSDSQYLVKGLNLWLAAWQKNNWKTAAKKPVLNKDLWKSLAEIIQHRKGLRVLWVKGHEGIEENERTDQLAKQAAEKARETLT